LIVIASWTGPAGYYPAVLSTITHNGLRNMLRLSLEIDIDLPATLRFIHMKDPT